MNRNSAYFRGTIISIRNENSVVSLDNCIFNSNSGITGGLFYVNKRSVLNVLNSTLFSNFALSSSIAYVNADAVINIENSIVYRNRVLTTGMIELIDSSTPSTLFNNTIYSNTIVSKDSLNAELDNPATCVDLCFATEGYIEYLNGKRIFLEQVVTRALFAVIEGALTINQDNKFYSMNQISIGYGFRSTFIMNGCSMKDLNIRDHMFVFVGSYFEISGCQINNITRDLDATGRVMSFEDRSEAAITNLEFQDISLGLITSIDSELRVNDTKMENITAFEYIVEIYTSYEIKFNNLTVLNCETTGNKGIISFRSSTIDLFENSFFEENQLLTIIFRNSNVKSFNNNVLNGMNRGISIENKSNVTITNSTFKNFQQNIKEGDMYVSTMLTSGSALEIIDSNVEVYNWVFMDNTAIYGGAINVMCDYLLPCQNTIFSSYFRNNTARENGGAIQYNSYAPEIFNNTYKQNSAVFGKNVASYAVSIEQLVGRELVKIKELNDIPSGIDISETITLALVNAEGDSIMVNDNFSYIKFSPLDDSTDVKGQDTAVVNQGVASFTKTQFLSEPGKSNVPFLVESSAIDYGMIQFLDPVKYSDQLILINFRWCMPGEIQIGNICSPCTVGSYSVIWNSTECHNCPDNAFCEGKEISLDKGYWRINANSTEIIECPNEQACLGGFNESNIHPVNCEEGYTGYLCNEWITEGDTKYERIAENTCSKCIDTTINIIRIIGFGLLIIVFLIILVAVNLQKKEDSNISVLMRIMTNYIQILAAAMAFNMNFPNYIAGAFTSAQRIGESSGIFLSFDCLLMDSSLVESFDNVAYLKVFWMSLVPILLIGISAIIFRLLFLKNSVKFKRYLCVTVITVFFVLHPSLTQYCLRIFKCVSIGEGNNQVEMDVPTECWSGTHLKWIFGLGVPMLIIYVIGVPALAFLILYRARNNLSKPEVLHYILLLYQGLKHETYYWELCNTLRKAILLWLHVFIPDDIKMLKGLFGVLVLFFFSTLQLRLKPFKINVITKLEGREMLSSLLTLYGGLIFVQDETPLLVLNIGFFITIVIANVRFLILWVYWVTTVYKKHKFAEVFGAWLKKAFCIDVSDEDEDYLCYRSKLTTSLHTGEKSKETRPNKRLKSLIKYTTNQNLVENNVSKHTQRAIQELDETFESSRTPKKLISFSKRHLLEPSSMRSNVHFSMEESQNINRRKKKIKKVKRKVKKGQKIMTSNANEDHESTIDFFGHKFRTSDLHTRMGGRLAQSSRPNDENEEDDLDYIEAYNPSRGHNMNRDLAPNEENKEDNHYHNIIFEGIEQSTPDRHFKKYRR